MNSFGQIFRFTTFGESHGEAIGGVIDGMPAGVVVDMQELQRMLDRRRPGQSAVTTQRNEADKVEILSGIFNGVTTGAPIGFIIRNNNQRSADYDAVSNIYRPNHADYTYQAKYGVRDYRGGGRASARETACRVVAGALAAQALRTLGIEICAYTSRIGKCAVNKPYYKLKLDNVDANAVRCPDGAKAAKMIGIINDAAAAGDTVGGVVTCVIKGVPVGLGDPVGGKLQALLAAAMMSINAAKGFEYGLGFKAAEAMGSSVIDQFTTDKNGRIRTMSNFSGGIQGGISNGEDIYFNVAFKPVATLRQSVNTVNSVGESVTVKVEGRHDPCVVPRAVPIVEAMAATVILDAYLLNRTSRI